ncbi:MAG: hypothetical protein ACI87L_001177 [Litorivivens sp.]|jgi:hypothetical protein
MPRNCRHRLITVLFALYSLLFMQLAVAAYACPDIGAKAAVMAEAGVPCAESMALAMDDEQPHLCQAHCQAESQSAEKFQLLSLLAVDALPSAQGLQIALPTLVAAPLHAPHLQRSTAPPLSIRNCCLRL